MATAAQLRVSGVVRGSEHFTSPQGAVYPPGICAETVGATGVFPGKVTIPPGGGARRRICMKPTNPPTACWAARKSKHSPAIGWKTASWSARVTIGSFPPRCRTSPSIAARRRPFLSARAESPPRRKARSCGRSSTRSYRKRLDRSRHAGATRTLRSGGLPWAGAERRSQASRVRNSAFSSSGNLS